LFVPSGKKAHPEQLRVKPLFNLTFPPFFPSLATTSDCLWPVSSMLPALFLLLLVLMSLPAVTGGKRAQTNAIFGLKPPIWPGACPTGPDQLISGSGCSSCYFDPSSASKGLSMASSGLSWTYSSPYDLVRPDNGLIISQVKFWSFNYCSVFETDVLSL